MKDIRGRIYEIGDYIALDGYCAVGRVIGFSDKRILVEAESACRTVYSRTYHFPQKHAIIAHAGEESEIIRKMFEKSEVVL